tara:strand:- start:184808 stop:185155 length:348 start_codon:yes stop_codon:yes gene_type:complete
MQKLLVLTLFVSQVAFANISCYERLTEGYGDSAHYSQHSSDVYSNSAETLDPQMAYNAVTKTLNDLGCSEKVELTEVQCTEALNTTLCRLDMKFGYFLILKDYVDTVNILFNRWD